MDFHRFPQIFTHPHRFSQIPTDFHCFTQISIDFRWVFLEEALATGAHAAGAKSRASGPSSVCAALSSPAASRPSKARAAPSALRGWSRRKRRFQAVAEGLAFAFVWVSKTLTMSTFWALGRPALEEALATGAHAAGAKSSSVFV